MEHCFEFVNTPLSSECYAECFTIIDYINSNEFNDYVTLIYIDNELHVLKHDFNKDVFVALRLFNIGEYKISHFNNNIDDDDNNAIFIGEERFIITKQSLIKPVGFCEDYIYIYDPPINKLVLE